MGTKNNGMGSRTPSRLSLGLKHVFKEIKQEKHQRDETLNASPAKRAMSDPIEKDDFDLNDEDNIEDFNAGNLDLKISRLRFLNPKIKIGMKPSKLKDDFKIGIGNDYYLEQFSKPQKHRILAAFANATRSNRFNPGKKEPNKSEHCKSTISCVAQTYRMAGYEDPTKMTP